jgi:anaerobic magnesium-protoporphyrin IX monomethyl ester cyclase
MIKASNRMLILFNPSSARAVGDSSLPMGLLAASSQVYQRFRVAILDQRVDGNWKSKFNALLEQEPLCLGVTAMTGKQIDHGLRVSSYAKSRGCPVIWGGVHASLLPAQTLADPRVDFVIEGEGEETLAELADALAAGESPGPIKGVWSKEEREPRFAGRRAFVDLNQLPPLPYYLVDLSKYVTNGPYGRFLTLYTSRGCPQRCTFCYNQSFNRSRWRAWDSVRVMEEIRRLRAMQPGLSHFQFWDDNFFVSLQRARDIAAEIMRLQPAATWSVLGAHVRDLVRMDDSFLACLQASGCKEMVIGVESGSQRILDTIRKNFKVEELLFVNQRLRRYGIRPTYSFLSGVPGETDDDLKMTVDLMFQLKQENPEVVLGNVKPFVCFPGTGLYAQALEIGFRPPDRLDLWSRFVWTNYINLDINWVNRKRRKALAWLYYYTVLMNPEYLFLRSRIFFLVASILRPISQWRVRRLWFRFPFTAWLMHQIQRIFF